MEALKARILAEGQNLLHDGRAERRRRADEDGEQDEEEETNHGVPRATPGEATLAAYRDAAGLSSEGGVRTDGPRGLRTGKLLVKDPAPRG